MKRLIICLLIFISGIGAVIVPVSSVAQAHTAVVHVSDKPLPKWFHWGNTSDTHLGHPCIVSWGGRLGSNTSKTLTCSDGFAKTFTPVHPSIMLTSARRCQDSYTHTVHTPTVAWSEVQWNVDTCNYTFRGISRCFNTRTGVSHIYEGGFVKAGGPPSRASCTDSLPAINKAGYDVTTPSGTTRHWYWSG